MYRNCKAKRRYIVHKNLHEIDNRAREEGDSSRAEKCLPVSVFPAYDARA